MSRLLASLRLAIIKIKVGANCYLNTTCVGASKESPVLATPISFLLRMHWICIATVRHNKPKNAHCSVFYVIYDTQGVVMRLIQQSASRSH